MSEKLSEEEIETYREVGKLTSEVREEACEMIEPGEKLLTVAERVEEAIREKGAKPAFPCNISINEKAAHYSPPEEDETEFEKDDLVKLDIGAHIDGYIADTATTVHVGEEDEVEPEKSEETEKKEEPDKRREMVQAINLVLERAIDTVEPGINVGDIGKVIEDTAKEQGYNPVSNLTGHTLKPWSLHGGVSIPNVEKDTDEELEEGDVVALEPFITDGEGEVEEMPEVYIFRVMKEGGVSGRMAQQTLRKIKSNYGNLPFAERWLTRDLSRIRLQVTLRDLLSSNVLRPYYVLKEVEDGLVAQAEHTMIVTEDGCEVTTR
ncbi:hypothetical protein AKJ37_00645 [candidate division MSBL1 archaeon SCGC-AAA259I09]|uniref:Methionine aminopeptidase n=5 Tax=candidate division MSBL1 TaxID=215777 RepID=A0A133UVR2_9EURY|nr:hypothetical protein AKJ61_00985 [candidate division MSBL1 archaeon SCGC-AAA259B11]KXA98277.1 hypothetical protein AKJ37_00645 [candidate division MSBL1 archaeon SCGC-AAA259I09]KXA98774.1 hypothetical protein AKJ39_00875 [candidate division MSBL1 archaeon SCGC-AAA259J03]KXB00832.1 hypothetical protein AKJ40_00260 [candidate division MSBL1 archaeon SCGC-AAA259M10]